MPSRRGFMLATAAVLAARSAHAQNFPSKVITIVVPYAAGGASDVIARLIGQQLNERLGTPVIIENKPGATTAIATQYVARAPADGHTLLLTAPPYVIGRYATPKPPYDVTTDFANICHTTVSPLIITAGPKLPAKTFSEFVTYARANPGKVSYASTGSMGLPHLAGELLAKKIGAPLLHVPYRGGGPAVNDLLGGQVDLYIANPIEVASHFNGGLKALAVTSRQRSTLLPDIPTVEEQGISDFNLSTWTGIFAPIATPQSTVDLLHREIVAILAMPDISRKLTEQFSAPVGSSIANFKSFLDGEHKVYAELVPGISQ